MNDCEGVNLEVAFINRYYTWAHELGLLESDVDSEGNTWKTWILTGSEDDLQVAINTCKQNWYTQVNCTYETPGSPPLYLPELHEIKGAWKLGSAVPAGEIEDWLDSSLGPEGPYPGYDPGPGKYWGEFRHWLQAAADRLTWAFEVGNGTPWRVAGYAVIAYWADVAGEIPNGVVARDTHPELDFIEWLACHIFLMWKSYGMEGDDSAFLAEFDLEALPEFDAGIQPTAAFVISRQFSYILYLPVNTGNKGSFGSLKARFGGEE